MNFDTETSEVNVNDLKPGDRILTFLGLLQGEVKAVLRGDPVGGPFWKISFVDGVGAAGQRHYNDDLWVYDPTRTFTIEERVGVPSDVMIFS